MSGIIGFYSTDEPGSVDFRETFPAIGKAAERYDHAFSRGVVNLGVSPLTAQRTAGRSLLHSDQHGLTVAFFGELHAPVRTSRRYDLSTSDDDIGIFLGGVRKVTGDDCLKTLDGQFSAVVVDHSKNAISLLQDRIGGFHGFYYLLEPRRSLLLLTIAGTSPVSPDHRVRWINRRSFLCFPPVTYCLHGP